MEAIGIYLDGPTLRMATARKRGFAISDAKSFNISVERPNVKPLYMTRLVSGLPTQEVLFRGAEIPPTRHQELAKALAHHAETTHHLDPDEALSAPLLRNQGRILYALTTRTALAHHLKQWKRYDIDPDWVVPVPTALARYWTWECELAEGWILDIGFNETTVALLSEGIAVQSHGIPIGMGQLYEELSVDRRQSLFATEAIDLERANGPFRAKLDELVAAIDQTLLGMDRTEQPRPLLLSGHLDAFPAFSSFLFRNIARRVTELHLADTAKMAIAIGLAIEGLGTAFNFRTGSHTSRRERVRSGTLLSLLLLASCTASIALWSWGSHLLQGRRHAIATTLESILPAPLREQILIDRDPEGVMHRWRAIVCDAPKSPPYPLAVASVSELYAWWENHPLRAPLNLQLESLTYELQDPHVKPAARIHLIFTAQNPLDARKFHDALLEDPAIIGPVEWTANGTHFEATFSMRRHVR